MPLERVKYRNWIFEVDRLQTEFLYSNINVGGAESCNCGICSQFLELREIVFPDEVKQLFVKLGVDITKDYEIVDYGSDKEGHYYNGWFHFVGRIMEGNDCHILQPNGYNVNATTINENFEIGFSNKVSASHFKDHNDLIEIDFFAKLDKYLSKR